MRTSKHLMLTSRAASVARSLARLALWAAAYAPFSNLHASASPMPCTRNWGGALATTSVSTSTSAGAWERYRSSRNLWSSVNITASAIWSALVAHCVGTQTTGTQSFSPTAFAVSTDLPPPQPIMTSMSRSSAFAATSSIFLLVHSVTLSSKPTRGTPAVSRLAWTLALTLAKPVLPPISEGPGPVLLHIHAELVEHSRPLDVLRREDHLPCTALWQLEHLEKRRSVGTSHP